MQINSAPAAASQDLARQIARHDRLIRSLVRRFSEAFADDLFQVGRMALVEAAASFDPSKGVQLWTYARRAVLGAIVDYATKEIRGVAAEQFDDLGESDEASLSNHSGADDRVYLQELLAALSTTESEVVTLRVRDGLTFEEASERLGRSISDVDRIYRRALITMRERAQ